MFWVGVQVVDINIKGQSPVGNGTVICASVYCGPDVDFGDGPMLWIDTLHDPTTLQVTHTPRSRTWISPRMHALPYDLIVSML